MKRTFGKRCFSMLLAAAVALGGLTLPPAKTGQAAAVEKQEETRKVNFNQEWKFKLGNVSGAEQKNYNDASWETVTIPHDFSIT